MKGSNITSGLTLCFSLAILSAGILHSHGDSNALTSEFKTQCNFRDEGQWLTREVELRFTPFHVASKPATTWYVVGSMTPQIGRDLTLSSDGIHKIRFWSVDATGRKESPKSVTVKIDRTPPFTTSDFTRNRTWTPDPVTVHFTTTDNVSGIHTTRFSINNSPWDVGSAVRLDVEGIFHLRFYSIDMAGNREAVQSVVVQIDRTPPGIKLRSPEADRVYPPSVPLQLLMDVTDHSSGVRDRSVELDGDPFFPGSIIPALEPGRHFLRIVAEDRAGNRAEKEILFEVSE